MVGLLLILNLFIAMPAQASFTIEDLLGGLKRTSALQSRYIEEKYLSFLTEPVVSEGTLTFRPPDRLERQVLRPKKETVIIEGNFVSLQAVAGDPPLKVRLSDHPPLEALATALRALFAGDKVGFLAIFTPHLTGSKKAWSLELRPKTPDLAKTLELLRLSGKDDSLESIEMVESNGDRTVTVLNPKAGT
ncbi:MAG: LolA-related protein [Pseudomonadota bacterium]